MTGRGWVTWHGPEPARRRLALLATALVAVTLLLFGLVAYFVLDRTLRQQLDQSLYDRAQVISGRTTISGPIPSGTFAVSPPDVDAITAGGAVAQAYLLFSGDVVRSENLGPRDLPVTPRAIRAAERREPMFETVQVEFTSWRVYSTPLLVGGRPVGLLQVAQPVQGLNATLTLLRIVLVGAIVGGVGATFLLSWWLPVAVGPRRRDAGARTTEAFQAAMLARLRAGYARGELTLTEYEADLQRLLLRAPGGEPPPDADAASSRPAS
jgi:two-component system OmpR family sensor kinase